MNGQHDFQIKDVGTVTVSTIFFPTDGRPGYHPYWESAIVWPEEWEGTQFACDDGIDIIACDRTIEDADETHAYWCVPARLAQLAAAHMRNRWTEKDWHGTGRRGTWNERLTAKGA